MTLLIPFASMKNAQATINKNDFFTYTTNEYIHNGDGEYYDYQESTVGSGRYEIQSIQDNNVTVHYEWSWLYQSDTDPSKSDSRNSYFYFDRNTRAYLKDFDLDENIPGAKKIWFWINPAVNEGDYVQILDKLFLVTNLQATVWSSNIPRTAIELTYTGRSSRDDAYGNFDMVIQDRYYMDRETGYIIAERYHEHDTGYYQGMYASFDWEFEFDVKDSSYALPIDYMSFSGLYVLAPVGVIAVLVAIGYLVLWRPKTYESFDAKLLTIKRIWHVKKLPSSFSTVSHFFGPFMENMIKKAILAKDRVAYAYEHNTNEGNECIGIAIYHRDAKIGTIFAEDIDANEYLRRYIKAKDFFSEFRHKTRIPVAQDSNRDLYNIYETHKILFNDTLIAQSYDHNLIRLMTARDIPELCEISKKIYKIKGKRWYKTLLKQGDIGVVAVVGNTIAGFGFATVCGDHARFHTLTVHPDYRGRGIGKELMRARLAMMYNLGITDVMVEIADWNLPSLRIATRFGFILKGEMYVETIRKKRVKRNIIRR